MKVLIAISCVMIIILSLALISQKKHHECEVFEKEEEEKRIPSVTGPPDGKTIWMLWFQGWENAPKLAHKVKQAWIKLNPDWKVICLDEKTLPLYIDLQFKDCMGYQARSDLVRLSLLNKYGGVWADASLVPFIPLDDWIYDALQPVGFWMFHGRDYGKGPASWFIISIKQSYIIKKWSERSID